MLRSSRKSLIKGRLTGIILSNMKNSSQTFQHGGVSGWMIAAICAITLFLATSVLSVWLLIAYTEQKSDVNGKINLAVAAGVKKQSEEDEVKFQESYKNPKIEFVGPSEYGRVSFMYPKTWSVYIDKDGSDRKDYMAYLHPVSVPSISNSENRFAMRLEILNRNFDDILKQYEAQLKKGELKSSNTEYNGIAATRLDGAFSKDLRGSVVLMKVRDKTIRVSTDADTFKPDFDAVLGTVKFEE